MKPKSKNTEKSHRNANETASCYDLSKLIEAFKVAKLNKIHCHTNKSNGNGPIDEQKETASCYDLSKLSEALNFANDKATEAIGNTANYKSNVATDATTAKQNENDSPFDLAELEEALDAAEEKCKNSLRFKARQVLLKRQQKHQRMYLSNLDLIDWDESENEELEPTMQQQRNYSILFRLGRIVEIGAARRRGF